MDKVVGDALARRAELLKEIGEIDLFLSLYKKFGGNVEQDTSEHAVAEAQSRAVDRSARMRGRPDDFADLMEQILREKRRPLSRQDFVDEIEGRGHEIPSDDKPRYLGTILWRQGKRFRNLPKFGYWLIGEPYQPANYDPEKDTEADRLLDEEPEFLDLPSSGGDNDA